MVMADCSRGNKKQNINDLIGKIKDVFTNGIPRNLNDINSLYSKIRILFIFICLVFFGFFAWIQQAMVSTILNILEPYSEWLKEQIDNNKNKSYILNNFYEFLLKILNLFIPFVNGDKAEEIHIMLINAQLPQDRNTKKAC